MGLKQTEISSPTSAKNAQPRLPQGPIRGSVTISRAIHQDGSNRRLESVEPPWKHHRSFSSSSSISHVAGMEFILSSGTQNQHRPIFG